MHVMDGFEAAAGRAKVGRWHAPGVWVWWLAVLVGPVWGTTVYRCTGADGVTIFGDRKVPGAQCGLVAGSGDAPSPPVESKGILPAAQTRALDGGTTSASVIDERYNRFEFRDRAVFAPFHQKWSTAAHERLSIAHFGDSHLQNGFAIEAARTRLQRIRGDGGRGMVFPYSIANSYSPNDYRTAFHGRWTTANSQKPNPRMALGVSGFVARTESTPASFSFKFKTALGEGRKRVRVLLRASGPGLRLVATSAGQSQSVSLEPSPLGRTPAVDFDFAQLSETLRFDVVNLSRAPASLELHGLSIENPSPGLVYHNLGVGGATFGALNAQTHFEEQIALLGPDLYVLDWGTNDIAHRNALPENLRDTVASTIRRIRLAHPGSVIVLTSVQDMRHNGRHISSARAFSELMKAIAFEHGCLFYDWYRVAGGAGSMVEWVGQGLASKDHVHLTAKGYRLKGDLFAKALLKTLDGYASGRKDSGFLEVY
jgi:lysophospholipase L1-like esterase